MFEQNLIPMRKGGFNLTTGTFPPGGFVCQQDGSLTIIDDNLASSVLALKAGDAVRFFSDDTTSVTITSGQFIIARG